MKLITRGETLPKYYGVTYFDYQRCIYICNIFPLNHIIGYGRKLFNKIRNNVDDTDILQGRIKSLENIIKLHKQELTNEFIKGYTRGLEKIIKKNI